MNVKIEMCVLENVNGMHEGPGEWDSNWDTMQGYDMTLLDGAKFSQKVNLTTTQLQSLVWSCVFSSFLAVCVNPDSRWLDMFQQTHSTKYAEKAAGDLEHCIIWK